MGEHGLATRRSRRPYIFDHPPSGTSGKFQFSPYSSAPLPNTSGPEHRQDCTSLSRRHQTHARPQRAVAGPVGTRGLFRPRPHGFRRCACVARAVPNCLNSDPASREFMSVNIPASSFSPPGPSPSPRNVCLSCDLLARFSLPLRATLTGAFATGLAAS
jgi:hypothetical protein